MFPVLVFVVFAALSLFLAVAAWSPVPAAANGGVREGGTSRLTAGAATDDVPDGLYEAAERFASVHCTRGPVERGDREEAVRCYVPFAVGAEPRARVDVYSLVYDTVRGAFLRESFVRDERLSGTEVAVGDGGVYAFDRRTGGVHAVASTLRFEVLADAARRAVIAWSAEGGSESTPTPRDTGPGAASEPSRPPDPRCVRDPGYFEVHRSRKNGFTAPTVLKRCSVGSAELVEDRSRVLEYASFRDGGGFSPSSRLYVDAVLPSHVYVSVPDGTTGRERVEAVALRHEDVLGDPAYASRVALRGKLRVLREGYEDLLDFCRYSIHTHFGSDGTVCCGRACSRPEPLTDAELEAVRRAAAVEPFYTCSWLEKRVLFKWNVGHERFEPYLRFECAVGVYSDARLRHDANAQSLFGFHTWKCPDEGVTNADEVYFRSPTNLAGYRWYEPSATDDENHERYSGRGGEDRASSSVARDVMNLARLPDAFALSSSLVRPLEFGAGVEL